MTDELTKRKLAKAQEIDRKYTLNNAVEKLLLAQQYFNTSDLCCSSSYKFTSQGFRVRPSRFKSILNIVIIVSVQALVFFLGSNEFRQSWVHVIFQCVISLGLLSWILTLWQGEVLQIDHSMIRSKVEDFEVRISDVIRTHIRQHYSGVSTSNYLVINYYDVFNDSFEEKEIDLTSLNTTSQEVACAIEYFKSNEPNGRARQGKR